MTSHTWWLTRQNHLEVFRNLIRNLVPTWDKRLCTRSFFHGRFGLHGASYTKKTTGATDATVYDIYIYCFDDGFKDLLFYPYLAWGNVPIGLIFFRWIETTNYSCRFKSYQASGLFFECHFSPSWQEFHVLSCVMLVEFPLNHAEFSDRKWRCQWHR